MHYNTHDLIKQDPAVFKKMVGDKYGIPVLIVDPGQTIAL